MFKFVITLLLIIFIFILSCNCNARGNEAIYMYYKETIKKKCFNLNHGYLLKTL